MVAIVNTHQAEAWNGYEGRHWADHQDRYDTANDGMNKPIFEAAAITETDRVLDVGCGNGRTARLAARQAPRGHVTGIDLSAPMLDRARATAAGQGITNVTFEQGDAQVHPFPDGGFDVAISRGGVMYFADPVAAFTNIRRALRPGGRLAIACPQRLTPGADFARALAPLWALMSRYAPATEASDEEAGPTSLSDPDRIGQVLTGAGFTAVTTTPLTVPMVFGRDAADAADFFVGMGPMHFTLRNAGLAEVQAVHAALIGGLRDFEDAGAVVLQSALWLVQATGPILSTAAGLT
jgi:SAM-dependent methyltransferase